MKESFTYFRLQSGCETSSYEKTAPKTIDYLSEGAKNHFDKVCSLLDDLEIDYVIDTNLVRGIRLLFSYCF